MLFAVVFSFKTEINVCKILKNEFVLCFINNIWIIDFFSINKIEIDYINELYFKEEENNNSGIIPPSRIRQ